VAWLTALADADAWTYAMILVAAGVYASSLVAAGAVLFTLAFPMLPDPERRTALRTVAITAWIAIALLLLQWPLQAGYLGGGNIASALDPMLLGIVFEGAPGTRLSMALAGLVLIQAIVLLNRRHPGLGYGLSLAGVGLVAVAFVQVGHTTGEPRVVMSSLLVVHLIAAAFWIGALWPLYRMTLSPSDPGVVASILAGFGRIAAVAVGALLLSGVILAVLLLDRLAALFDTSYGQFLLTKVVVVSGLLALAAANKWRLVPAFERGDPQAPAHLRRSIALEMGLVAVIVLVTGALTTLGSPASG
jgi:copper resistance protein D